MTYIKIVGIIFFLIYNSKSVTVIENYSVYEILNDQTWEAPSYELNTTRWLQSIYQIVILNDLRYLLQTILGLCVHVHWIKWGMQVFYLPA